VTLVTVTDRAQFVQGVFGSGILARDGVNIAVRCPKCKSTQEKKKFSINLETWQCHCWICDLRGKTLYPILKKYFGPEDLSEYAETYLEGNFFKSPSSVKNTEEEELVSLPQGFCLLVDNLKSSDPNIKSCLKYLKSRKISEKDLWYFKIGTAHIGKFKRKIIIPSFDFFGNLNYFVARAIDSKNRFRYMNAHINKKKIIFNEINIDWNQEVTITEGPFDLMKCNYNATCLLGSSLTEDSLLFSKLAANRSDVLLALDSDMKNKSQKFANLLAAYDCNVRIVNIGNHSDVGEMTRAEFKSTSIHANIWTKNSFLLDKIRSIDSGSII
jgi:hypothetical protein